MTLYLYDTSEKPPHESISVTFKRFFFQVQVFPSAVFIATFRFCAGLGVMEVQLLNVFYYLAEV